MVKLPSAKVCSKSVSVSYPGQSLKCVKVTTLGPRTLQRLEVCVNFALFYNALSYPPLLI